MKIVLQILLLFVCIVLLVSVPAVVMGVFEEHILSAFFWWGNILKQIILYLK